MSLALAAYLLLALAAWRPCTRVAARVGARSGRRLWGAVLAAGWPLAIPLLVQSALRRARSAVPPLAAGAPVDPDPVGTGR
jgi:hypothetical protein